MTTKKLIKEEIDHLSDEHVNELYKMIKSFPHAKTSTSSTGLLAKLKRIKIDAPEDFASNVDLYISGEKSVE